jgi:hypothetical protein
VPGWFQATLALYDGRGNEVKYVDDFLFHPDPVLYYKIPKTDDFTLVINDSIYRGREDFVYRVTVGEIPFVTSIFPRGGRNGESTTIDVDGWNLKVKKLTLPAIQREPGVQLIDIVEPPSLSNRALFAVDTLPEVLEAEPNDGRDTAQKLSPPLIVNGRIDRSGDVDVFHFEGRAGGRIVAEVQARRLNSPLDSWLELTDANGKQLAVNDDNEDRGSGLTTHHADARICFTLPEGGTHFIRLKDAQNKGGAAYAYRLRVSARRPDFELRAVPSSLNARVGTSVSFTVYALRRDEFTDAVSIALKDPPPGFVLSGGEIPAKKDEAKLTLKVPAVPTQEPVRLVLQGKAVIKGSEVTRPVIPAEDMMQAFIYRHLVTVEDLLVSVTPRASK